MIICIYEVSSIFSHTLRYTGQAICALGANKQGASQLLAGGVLTILANLSKPGHLTRNCESASGHDEGSGGDGAGAGGMGREGHPAAAADGLLLGATNLSFSRYSLHGVSESACIGQRQRSQGEAKACAC